MTLERKGFLKKHGEADTPFRSAQGRRSHLMLSHAKNDIPVIRNSVERSQIIKMLCLYMVGLVPKQFVGISINKMRQLLEIFAFYRKKWSNASRTLVNRVPKQFY